MHQENRGFAISNYISLTVNSANSNVQAEMFSLSTASAHLLLVIGLDRRLSCRLRVVGKQIGMLSEVINYNSEMFHPHRILYIGHASKGSRA